MPQAPYYQYYQQQQQKKNGKKKNTLLKEAGSPAFAFQSEQVQGICQTQSEFDTNTRAVHLLVQNGARVA